MNFLLSTLGMTKGNRSRHIERLGLADYIRFGKTFDGRIPSTGCQLAEEGSEALTQYRKEFDVVRQTGRIQRAQNDFVSTGEDCRADA